VAITSGGGATVSDGSSGWVSPGNGTAVHPQSHVCPSCGYCDHCGRRDAAPWNPYRLYPTYPQPWYQPWFGVVPPYPYGTMTVTCGDSGVYNTVGGSYSV
jgi:hypothetical protein